MAETVLEIDRLRDAVSRLHRGAAVFNSRGTKTRFKLEPFGSRSRGSAAGEMKAIRAPASPIASESICAYQPVPERHTLEIKHTSGIELSIWDATWATSMDTSCPKSLSQIAAGEPIDRRGRSRDNNLVSRSSQRGRRSRPLPDDRIVPRQGPSERSEPATGSLRPPTTSAPVRPPACRALHARVSPARIGTVRHTSPDATGHPRCPSMQRKALSNRLS